MNIFPAKSYECGLIFRTQHLIARYCAALIAALAIAKHVFVLARAKEMCLYALVRVCGGFARATVLIASFRMVCAGGRVYLLFPLVFLFAAMRVRECLFCRAAVRTRK